MHSAVPDGIWEDAAVRIRIDLAYDGGGFHGWALQPGLRTVQGEFQAALATALRVEAAWVTVAGRTDTGVHARGQVTHCDVDDDALARSAGRATVGPMEALVRRLNGILPDDIRVHRALEAPDGFDARFSAISRRYTYRVADRPAAYDPLTRGHVLHWPRPLDLAAMNAAAVDLLGLHDFTSFCKAREGSTAIRRLQSLVWERTETGVAEATVVADAFCHSMVRSLVGALLAIGEGRRDVGWARELLERTRRSSDVHIASARGLTLEEVVYPPDAELGARRSITMARRQEAEVE